MTCTPTRHTRNPKSLRMGQRGIAAVELALVLIPLLLLLFGIASLGAVFHMQHVLTRAAEDGARVVSMYIGADESELRSRIAEAVNESLGASLQTFTDAPLVTGSDPVLVVIRMNYKNNPLLSHLPWTDGWLPEMLQGSATASSPL